MLKFDIEVNLPADVLAEPASRAEHILAIQAEKDTTPYVPALTGSLSNRTKVQGGTIIYPGPYARYLYYGKVMVDAYGKGPMHFTDKYGNEVTVFPKGSVLHATDRDLVFTKSVHPFAQARWFEASKAANMERWERVAGKAMKHELHG